MIKNNIHDIFLCVCVDTDRNKVPKIIESVPSIFVKEGPNPLLLVDEKVEEYVLSFAQRQRDDGENTEDGNGGVQPLEGNAFMVDQFSYIDETENLERQKKKKYNCGPRFVPASFDESIDDDALDQPPSHHNGKMMGKPAGKKLGNSGSARELGARNPMIYDQGVPFRELAPPRPSMIEPIATSSLRPNKKDDIDKAMIRMQKERGLA
jgi:hypothetical protein